MASGSAGARPKKVPQRMCVGCGQLKPKKELLRVVRTPEGAVEFDTSPAGKKPGRGAYLCPDRECLTKAVKGKRLERALEHPISEEIWAKLEAGMVTTG
jgi:predicted RNA-binding protein YlxR (DUF448 family)